MWYVVQTAIGREQDAVEKCRSALEEEIASRIFTPRCKLPRKFQGEWQSVEKVAFPGYVFVESDSPAELEEMLLRIPGVVTPVRIGGGFYPIRSDEEAVLRQLMDENDCICASEGYLVDQKLMVNKGPLKPFAEKVKKIDRHKRFAEVEIILFEECRQMRVGLEVKGRVTMDEYLELVKSA